MANVLIQDSTMQEIADAIREKTGETASMLPHEMPDKILSISGRGESPETWDGEASEFDLTFTVVTGLSVTMMFYNVTSGNTISVDWGDGTSENATTTTVGAKTFTHAYPAIGDYTASVDSTGDYYPYGLSTAINMFALAINYTCTGARLGTRCTSIGNYAFYKCYSLTSILISDSVTSIGDQAFRNCHSLTSIIIPDGVTSIGDYAFIYCIGLTSETIPDGVTSIGTYAFYGCYSLTSITIPDSVTSINTNAFIGCTSIKKYTMLPVSPPTLSSTNAFSDINGICIMLVPKGALEAYQTATNWVTYADYMREMTDEEMIYYGLAAA